MAGYSVESLLAWMKDTSRLFGWDGVMALSGDKVNEVLQQGYKLQLSQGVTHQVPGGSISISGTNISYYFTGFVLGAPKLLFTSASFDVPTFPVRMPVVSGVLTQVTNEQGVARILRLSAYEPAKGPLLHLDLQLNGRGAVVDVDLALGENTLFMFARTPNEQRKAGEFFQAWLCNPANEGRAYPLSDFADQSNPLLAVRRVDVRAQLEDANDRQPEKRGAVLFFVTMEHGATGAFPGNEGDLRYLIPNDTQPVYSATSLFSLRVLYRAAFGHAVLQLLESGEFEFANEPSGPLQNMIARSGNFQVAASHYLGSDYEFQAEPFTVSAGSGQHPLTVVFEREKASQSWQFPCTVTVRHRAVGGAQWTTHIAVFEVSLRHEFRLWADETGAHAMEGQLFSPYADDQEVVPVSGLPGTLPLQLLEQIKGFIAYTIKSALLERFSQILNTTATEIFLDQWALAGEQGVQPLLKAMPHDLAMFGKVGGGELHIVEQNVLLLARASFQFSTAPAAQGVRWTLENVFGSEGDTGSIDDQGLYRAPPAHTMAQGFHRVLVVAKDSGNQVATALVTIQAYGVGIDPLIEVCSYTQQVTLSASILGDGVQEWSIRNPVVGESGDLIADDPYGDHTYVPKADVDAEKDKAYVLEEIQVRDSLSGQTRSAWVLVIQPKGVALEVKPASQGSPVPGQIRVQALFKGNVMPGVQWTLGADSPGEITADGLYISDPMAPQRFALIFAALDGGDFGVLEGHLILPLPLNEFPDVLEALAG